MHLLLIEDEPKLARYVAQALHKGGCTVDISSDGASGLQRALEARHDAVVLDLTLPGCDGLEILRELRSRQHTVPILILSARGKPAERVEGLELGADDYLAKPFVMEELLARLRSLKRRASIPHTPPLVASDLIFHSATKTATRGGDKLDLSAREARSARVSIAPCEPGRPGARLQLVGLQLPRSRAASSTSRPRREIGQSFNSCCRGAKVRLRRSDAPRALYRMFLARGHRRVHGLARLAGIGRGGRALVTGAS